MSAKKLHQFQVTFSCQYNGDSESDAASYLKLLSDAIFAVELPHRTYDLPLVQNTPKAPFKQIQSDGYLKLTFTDDEQNRVQDALDFLHESTVSKIAVSVNFLNDVSTAIEQYVYGHVKMIKLEHEIMNRTNTKERHKILVLGPLFTYYAKY